MKSRFVLSLFAAVAAVALVGFTAGTAMSAHNVKIKLDVPVGLTPNDLHIAVDNAGGGMSAPSVTPAATLIQVVAGDSIEVVWGIKLAAGDSVEINFLCQNATKGVLGGFWTNDGDSIGPVEPEDVTVVNEPSAGVPGASPMVMLLIAMAIAAGGAVMLRRRVEA